MGDYSAMEGQDGWYALDGEFVKRTAGAGDRLLAGRAPYDQLGRKGIEHRRNGRAGNDAGIQTHAGAGRCGKSGNLAGRRQKATAGIFHVDTELDGMAAGFRHRRHADRQAFGNAELFDDEIETGRFFRYRMFHLQAGVDLEEGDHAIGGKQKFHRAGAGVTGFSADIARCGMDFLALFIGEERRRCFLDKFLVATLQRAVAGADHQNIAETVRQHLRLDMPRAVEKLLDITFAATEGGHRFTRGR
ncbi:hypothetical protein D3C73_571670 [compost metagenome]